MAKLILDEVLKRKGCSKRQLAKRMGVHYNHVFRYFREGYDPRLSTLNKMAQALGVKVKQLLRD
jgi:transcriptional regulator with XRE-family HTH domain